MRILVQKFGGTSVSDRAMRIQAIEHIEDALRAGYSVVVVVSAMGRVGEPYATDTLLNLIHQDDQVTTRDRDLLMSCGETISAVIFGAMLRNRGIEAAVLSGGQAGIVTSSDFGNARIAKIDPKRILAELEDGRVVVVTGFQGVTEDGEITTLGRGGSDTTATALGVALDAEVIDIFTDVEGIMTADPRLVNGAARLTHVTYTEICNFAYQGAKVIHPRAVELAMQKNIPIRVRATGSKDEGTLVTSASRPLEERPAQDRILTGVTHSARVTQLKVRSDAGRSGFQKDAFQAMAAEGISLDFFNVTPSEVTFTVPLTHEDRAITRLHELGLTVEAVRNVAKVAAVGAGIHGVPGVMARIVMALTERGIEILQSADSNTTIWCLVHEKDVAEAVRAIHDQFDLHAQGGV
ncbi:aspartate kinase [Ferroacidibacillus organovorans]|uniref:Aspartokinase n=2 Tax=Ferroacidibacillus organovorans TaxID=1765683 RepID=A0A1V4ERV8_9BACL|nr:aspartate kinase [Ferroacidibacillus organovorans]OPG15631.1 aspartate kinase [Ferroacidibacillus organovorans]